VRLLLCPTRLTNCTPEMTRRTGFGKFAPFSNMKVSILRGGPGSYSERISSCNCTKRVQHQDRPRARKDVVLQPCSRGVVDTSSGCELRCKIRSLTEPVSLDLVSTLFYAFCDSQGDFVAPFFIAEPWMVLPHSSRICRVSPLGFANNLLATPRLSYPRNVGSLQ
jgi:hypothetical protein